LKTGKNEKTFAWGGKKVTAYGNGILNSESEGGVRRKKKKKIRGLGSEENGRYCVGRNCAVRH